jgi:hypothetical protein
MPELRTLDICGLEWRTRQYETRLKDRWLSHSVWLRDMVAKYQSCALTGSRYLRRGESTILIATVTAGELELWLGWSARDDEAYYWALFAACLELFADEYLVTADASNAAIWIRR